MNLGAASYLKHYFGYDSFRPGQEEVVNSILSNRDTFAVMPTGAGKSLCYQVPALMLPGITLVISPLISLMQDQVKSLCDNGIKAAYINSSLSENQIYTVLRRAKAGMYKIIYAAPERLESAGFLDFAQSTEISMLTVDEAHCISQWGQDFRPSYLKILSFIRSLPSRPIVSAFTATATRQVQEDIVCTLGLREPKIVVTGFDRKNLSYSVEHTRAKSAFILDYLKKHRDESGIIYCATRKNTDKLTELLNARGYKAMPYHAGLSNEVRKQNQDAFVYDRCGVIVATNAFGMGIDKSNVRVVIHYNMPQSVENYYQEAGRAGRDGEKSECILLFSEGDVMTQRRLLEMKDFSDVSFEDEEIIRERDYKRLSVMEEYCKTTACLRNYILNYFGENTSAPCGSCGNCKGEYIHQDVTQEAKAIANCIYDTRSRFGMNIITGTLVGANRKRLREVGTDKCRTFGILKGRNEQGLKIIIEEMIREKLLCQSQDMYAVLSYGPEIAKLKAPDYTITIKVPAKPQAEFKTAPVRSTQNDDMGKKEFELFEKLRALRLSIAREEGMPPYIVFSDKTLRDMCLKMPRNEDEMLDVNGVGRHKYEKYGEQFLDEIRRFNGVPEQAEESAVAVQQANDDIYSNAGTPWFEDEDRMLRIMFELGYSADDIAAHFKRKPDAILSMLKHLGLM